MIYALVNPAVFVQVRYSSKRLPGKVLMEIEGMTLIERLYDRLLNCVRLPIVFLTSTDKSDDKIEVHLKEKKIPYFRGELNNVLKRFIDAGNVLNHSAFFRVTGDNPFVDAHAMAEHWEHFLSYDYVDNIHSEGNVIGTGFEFVKLNSLKAIPARTDQYDQEHVTTYIRANAFKFNSLRYKPKENKISEEIFLTCDYPEDFELIKKIYHHFDYSNHISVNKIISFLKINTHLLELNKHLHSTPNY